MVGGNSMGAWGVGLYQDDVTCDIKEEYLDRLRLGFTNMEATIDVINSNMDYIADEEDGPLFWFALAETQWKYGRLLPEVKEEALKCIDSGTDLERWKDNKKMYEKRKLVLESLALKLNSPQPPEKKVSKLVIKKANWEVGDVLLYKICDRNSEGKRIFKESKWHNKYILLRVLEIADFNKGSLHREYSDEMDIVGIYNWVGDQEPDPGILDRLELLKKDGKLLRRTLDFDTKDLKKIEFKVIKKDTEYSKKNNEITNGQGVILLDPYHIDDDFIMVLMDAEKDGSLADV